MVCVCVCVCVCENTLYLYKCIYDCKSHFLFMSGAQMLQDMLKFNTV